VAVAIIAVLFIAVVLFEQSQGVDVLGSLIGGKLSAADIAGYAQNAGFSGVDLVNAVAVALAESGGDPGAVGDLDLTPGGSVGLWQINLKAHPDLAGLDLTDPQTNANAAYQVYSDAGNSFGPWTTWKTGAYAAYMGAAAGVVNA
jgi:hypothetical protein